MDESERQAVSEGISRMNVAQEIERRLAALNPESLEVIDDSAAHHGHPGAAAGGGHYQLVIVSPAFAGISAQLRHRMVYDALGSLMQRDIHALAIKAYAPGEI
jgi:BolA family transcriptional regulator, general stress-responsive regulator